MTNTMKYEEALTESLREQEYAHGWNVGVHEFDLGRMSTTGLLGYSESFNEGYVDGQDYMLNERAVNRPSCPDCAGPLFRSNQTDGHWMCGECNESKLETTTP